MRYDVLMNDLVRRALAVNQDMLALGNEVFPADGATFVRNRSVPTIRDANHVAHVTARTLEEIDRLLARVEQEFAGYRHRRFDVDPLTPPEFEARLAHDGYQASDLMYMLLEGELQGEAKECDIRLVDTEADWEDYERLCRIDWRQPAPGLDRQGESWTAEEMFRNRRIKSPPARYWLAYVDGLPVSYLASWEGTEGVGLVDDLFTHSDYRHQGLATALIHRCVADCRVRLRRTGPVVIVADPHDTPKQMYAALGFRPVAIKRSYWKKVGE